MDNIGFFSFQSFHIKFKVILNLQNFKTFNEDIKGTTSVKRMQTCYSLVVCPSPMPLLVICISF
jgi:hypothetical protein